MSILIALLLALPLQIDGDSELSDEALIERIRETLSRVDEALLETSEARDAREGLSAAREHHLQVIRDLEKLISNQKYRQGGGGGGGSPESDPSSSPSQGESSARPSDGSGAPKPGEGENPEPQNGEQQGNEPESGEGGEGEEGAPQGQQPHGGAGDDSAGQNEPGGPPPPDALQEPVTREDVDERWGLLPPKLQERLMNLHVDDVPARYRSWMEAYVRAMHALEDRGSGR